MARAVLRTNREPWEVGQAIVAAWFKVLQKPGGRLTQAETIELKQVFEEIFATPIQDVILDPADNASINILVPQPPKEVQTQADLLNYLARFHNKTQPHHFHEELGDAVIFGCGR